MRRFVVLAMLLLASSLLVFAQDAGNRTPPGGDMLGSDWHSASGLNGNQRLDDDQGQRTSGTMGSTKGVTGSPAYAGSSEYEGVAAQSASGVTGQQGESAANAGRLRAENPNASAEDTGAIPRANGGPTSVMPMQSGTQHRAQNQRGRTQNQHPGNAASPRK